MEGLRENKFLKPRGLLKNIKMFYCDVSRFRGSTQSNHRSRNGHRIMRSNYRKYRKLNLDSIVHSRMEFGRIEYWTWVGLV